MNLQKTYPSLLTADLAAAEGWYTKLLGRGPDHRPMPTLLHWELSDEGGLMLSSSKDIATGARIYSIAPNPPASAGRSAGLGAPPATTIEAEYRRLRKAGRPDAIPFPSARPPD